MATILQTAKGTNNINTSLIVRDVSKSIAFLRPASTPLMTLLKSKVGSETAYTTKKEWIEDGLMSRWSNPQSAVADGTTTTINVATGTGIQFSVDDLVLNTTTNETVRVTGVSTDQLTVVRGYGDASKAAAMTTAHKLLNLGNMNMQGAGAPSEKSNNPTMNYNYTQIFRTPFSVTNTLEAIKLYGDQTELERLHMKKGIEHAVSIEQTMWFGKRNYDVSGSQPIGSMGGVAQFLDGTANMFTKALTSAVEDDIIAWCGEWFRYGSDTKVMITGDVFINWIHKLSMSKMNLIQKDNDKKYGLNVNTLVTPHGELKLVKHPLFTNGIAGRSYVLDMEMIDYCPLNGRDTKLKENIQNNDEDGRRDEYLTEATMQLKNPLKHGGLILT